jgi:hypothetical protein
MVATRLSSAPIMPAMPFTLDVTPASINFSVKKTKYPAAIAAAIGNPSSATSLKNSPTFSSFLESYYYVSIYLLDTS